MKKMVRVADNNNNNDTEAVSSPPRSFHSSGLTTPTGPPLLSSRSYTPTRPPVVVDNHGVSVEVQKEDSFSKYNDQDVVVMNSGGTESLSASSSHERSISCLNRKRSQTSVVAASATESPPIVVEVGYRIYSVTDINNVKNTASVDMRIFLLYRDEAMVGMRGLDGGHRPEEYLAEQLDLGNLSCRPYFPYVEIANAASTEEIDRGYRVVSNDGDVKFHFRVRTVVLQNLRFHCFPFDRHDITVKIRIPRKRDSDGVAFIMSSVYGGGNNNTGDETENNDCESNRRKLTKTNSVRSIKSYYDSISESGGSNSNNSKGSATDIVESYAHEWDFDRPQMRIVEESRGSSSSIKSTIQVIVPVSRHYHHYVHDILVILGFIVLAAGSVFFYEVNDLEGRINLIISCILTTVAFKFVCLEKIPPAPYATLLDIYIRTLFLLCGLGIIFCIIANQAFLQGSSLGKWVNDILGYAWFGIYVLAHVIYLYFVRKRCNLDIRRRMEARKGFT